MNDVTIYERSDIADFMRKLGAKGFGFDYSNIASAIGEDPNEDEKCWMRLANLIEPSRTPTLKDVHFWAFENVDGCDEPEHSLYNDILNAIQKYYDYTKE